MDKKYFLEDTDFIDWTDSAIIKKAEDLRKDKDTDTAKACFEFVRDKISHTWDVKKNVLTCLASEVLKYGTGFCYAKSHLLAALLRANGIPAGFCYQRLKNVGDNYCLHGFNAIYLDGCGWYKVDARGDKEGVKTVFSPPVESLAYTAELEGESTFPIVWHYPLEIVTEKLLKHSDIYEFYKDMPDLKAIF